jgi:hypothetical protein
MEMALASEVSVVVLAHGDPKADSRLPLVTVSRTELLVGHDHIADVAPGALGFDATLKRAGQRSALEVVPLKAALSALRGRDPSATRARLLVDASTAYRAALEVFFSGAHAGFTDFDFVVMSAAEERSLPVSTPSKAEWNAAHTPGAPQPPSFVLGDDGVSISVGAERVGEGCALGRAGVAVPRSAGRKLDVVATAACATRIHGMAPGWEGVRAANVSAAPGLTMQTVLEVVAAIREAYPVVHLGMITG